MTRTKLVLGLLVATGALGTCAGETDEGGTPAALEAPGRPGIAVRCGASTCDEGEACCRATGECYDATCVGCCPTELPPAVVHPSLRPDSGIAPQLDLPRSLPAPIPMPIPMPVPMPIPTLPR